MKITIEIKDEKVKVSTTGRISLPIFMQAVQSALLTTMNAFVDAVPEEHKEKVIEAIYNDYNYAASNLLTLFAPDLELRPHLTAEAILEMENKILERKAPLQ